MAAIFGCVILLSTNNRFGAVTGILLLGAAFAPIYPLWWKRSDIAFPAIIPAITTEFSPSPWRADCSRRAALGFFASVWGVGVVMDLPLMGSVIVFVLLVLIWVEARFLEASSQCPC